jgi:hypothetical protein
MNWQTAFRDDEKTVEVTYTGVVSREELSAAARLALDLTVKHGTNRVLTDCTAMQGGHSVADLYFLSDWLVSVKAYRMREAVLMPAEAAFNQLVQFWQTTCTNRGLNVRVFDRPETAWQWLSQRPHNSLK